MLCIQCGANIADGSTFCPQCGKQLGGTATPASAVPPGRTAPPPPPAGVTVNPPFQPAPAPAMYPAPVQPVYSGPQQTESKAIGSLVLGLLSVTILWFIAGIPAVILGHMSRSQIRKSMGRLKGEGLALAGLIMGYISLAATTIILLLAVIAIPSFVSAKRKAETAQATNTIRTINAEAIDYYTRYATSGYAPDLATLGQGPGDACTGGPTPQHACLIKGELGSTRCTGNTWCTSGKFRFLLAGAGSPATDYVIVATPMNENTGNMSYCSTSDAVVRSRYGVLTSPPSVAECGTWTPI